METTEKRQKAKVGVAGSFHNQLMSNNASLPIVGKGATEMHYSDRSCYEVIEVSADGRTVKLERLDAEADKTKDCQIGHQNWILKPTGYFRTIVWRNGAWRNVVKNIVWNMEFFKGNGFDKDNYNSPEYKALLKECLDENFEFKLIEGKTKVQMSYPKISILFGIKNYHFDWEF